MMMSSINAIKWNEEIARKMWVNGRTQALLEAASKQAIIQSGHRIPTIWTIKLRWIQPLIHIGFISCCALIFIYIRRIWMIDIRARKPTSTSDDELSPQMIDPEHHKMQDIHGDSTITIKIDGVYHTNETKNSIDFFMLVNKPNFMHTKVNSRKLMTCVAHFTHTHDVRRYCFLSCSAPPGCGGFWFCLFLFVFWWNSIAQMFQLDFFWCFFFHFILLDLKIVHFMWGKCFFRICKLYGTGFRCFRVGVILMIEIVIVFLFETRISFHRLYFKTFFFSLQFVCLFSLLLFLSLSIKILGFFLYECTDIPSMNITKLHRKSAMLSKRFTRSIRIITAPMGLVAAAVLVVAAIINNPFPIIIRTTYYRPALIVNHRRPVSRMRWVLPHTKAH